MSLIFVDVEAFLTSPCPGVGGGMTEFGAVEFKTRDSFHGITSDERSWLDVFRGFEEWLHRFPRPYVFISDNPAYDWQWINWHFRHHLGRNPFGHSARRIGDFYAGLRGNFWKSNEWKKLRVTPHDHNPVNDARGNAEAFDRMLKGER